ncbi:methyl-accepting chemotaxis protein [Paenibacillus sp. D2_2]|uniref:methyl-accepting chemotaxis protein n=1 Tax=Paenibacillus sp. D2_2 TaxID=3073092 RepID=UPI002815C948|nr:methyl-accepting chemotaxis protein [Paenibacillus sp. D2_2]WMT39538.1 methyl-accepting chemotaxis protein [Paenibacillus sp. D2_2]
MSSYTLVMEPQTLDIKPADSQDSRDGQLEMVTVEESQVEIASYTRSIPAISESTSCQQVLHIFQNNPGVPCVVPCDDSNVPTGLIMRDKFYKHLATRFAADLFYDRPAMMFAEKEPLICEISTPARTLLDAALERQDAEFYDCLIVTKQSKLYGVLTTQDLMLISRELERMTDQLRSSVIRESQSHVLEIASSVQQVSSISQLSLNESQKMSQLAKTGRSELEELKSSFSHVLEMMKQQQGLVSQLLEQTDEISSFTASIRELAERSKILAINASIESARAGEYGKGFSVVANEMRQLAQSTKQFSEDIGHGLDIIHSLIEETASAVTSTNYEMSASNDRVGKADETFRDLADSADLAKDRGREMSDSSTEATRITGDVLHNLTTLM